MLEENKLNAESPFKKRIVFFLVGTLALNCIFCFLAINRIDYVNKVSAESIRVFPVLTLLSEINADLAALRQAKDRSIVDSKTLLATEEIKQRETHVASSLSKIDSIISVPAERNKWNETKAELLNYLKVTSSFANRKTDSIQNKRYNLSFQLYTNAVSKVNGLSNFYQNQLLLEVQSGVANHAQARAIIQAGGLVLGLFFMLLGIYLYKKIYYHLRELSKSEAKFRAILESSSDAHFFLTPDHRVVSFNRAALAKINAMSHHTLRLGDDFLRLHSDEKRSAFLSCFKTALAGEEQFQEHTVVVDGEEKWFRRYYYPVKNSQGQVIGVAINSENISEQKKTLEKIQQQVQTLTEISHIQSHKLRGPVASILGLNSLFNHENPADKFNSELIVKIDEKVKELDLVVREIVYKTYIN